MLDQVNVKVGLTKEEWAQRKLEKKALPTLTVKKSKNQPKPAE